MNARLAWPLLGLLVCGLLAWPGAARWAYDDPYITYRYAENLLHGQGFVYNQGLRVLSTTTPGYTLLLAALGALWPNLPLLSNFLGLLAILGCGLLLALLLPPEIGRVPLTLAALLLALLAPAYTALGSEMPIYTLLSMAAFVLAERERPLPAGLLAGLVALLRPDGALVVLVVALAFWRQPRALLVAALAAALVAGPWYLFSLGYFGSLIPATLATKRAQLSQIAGSPGFLARLAQTLLAYARQPWYWPLLPCLVAGLWALARQRWLPLLLIWALLYACAYSALGVAGYAWYLVPLFPALVWLAGLGAARLGALVPGQARWRPPLAAALAGALLLVPLLGAALGLLRLLAQAPEPRAVVYRAAGEWLAAQTPPAASVGALEVGIIGYHSQRSMVDFAGLIQPDVAASAGTSYSDWGAVAMQHYRPDFVALPAALGAAFGQQPWFSAHYQPIKRFAAKGYEGELVVYARR